MQICTHCIARLETAAVDQLQATVLKANLIVLPQMECPSQTELTWPMLGLFRPIVKLEFADFLRFYLEHRRR